MKILIVTPIFPPEVGGPARYSWDLLRLLSPKHFVKVVCFAPKKIELSNVVSVGTDKGTIKRQWQFFKSCLQQCRGCDVMLLFEPLTVGLAGLLAGKILGKKVILKYVGDVSWETARNQGITKLDLESYLDSHLDWRRLLTLAVLTFVDQIITPSVYLERVLSKYYFVSRGKIKAIPNSVDLPVRKISKIKNQIIYSGRLVDWKNLDLVLHALSHLSKTSPWKLLIVGDGPEKRKLVQLCAHLKLKNRVQFLGSLNPGETLGRIVQSELLILFSDYEGMSHVILEGMANGAVVIASDIPSNADVIADKSTGFLVPRQNIDLLTKTVAQLLANPKFCLEISQKARHEIEQHYTWSTNLPSLINAFNNLIGKS